MDERDTVQVFLIGAHRLTRAAYRELVESEDGFEVAGECDTCAEAIRAVPRTANVLLIDLPDADIDSLRDLRKVLAAAPKVRPIVITPAIDTAARTQLVRSGAMGLVTSDNPAAMLFTAMKTVAHQHQAWIDRATMTEVVRTLGEPQHVPSELLNSLTRRERDIVDITLQGLKNRQVADRLFISETTVRHHLTSIFNKLGVSSRFELIQFAYRHGLAKPPIEIRK